MVQDFGLISSMSVYKNVRIPLLYSSHKLSNAKNVILPILEQLDISDKIDENVNNLSGGQRHEAPSQEHS